MRYAFRRPATLFGEHYKPGDIIDGSEIPADLLNKLTVQKRLLPVQNEAAPTPTQRGKRPKAAVAVKET